MKISSKLISGAGNTFHIAFDEGNKFSSEWTTTQMKTLTREACLKNPADGFIFLEKSNEGYSWFFYNNDGSDAEMCGNATRCVGFYIKNILHSSESEWFLKTVAGPIKIEFVETENFKITMTPIIKLESELGFFCDTGVPHLVLQKEEIKIDDALKTEARNLRNHASFFPRGTNVTYVVLEKETKKIKAVSYERGVEDFTAACGTGAMAAALFNLAERKEVETQVEMPGGTLMMNLSNLQKPLMIGLAVLLGSYEYEITK
jgi:diaminopimelate epimerase